MTQLIADKIRARLDLKIPTVDVHTGFRTLEVINSATGIGKMSRLAKDEHPITVSISDHDEQLIREGTHELCDKTKLKELFGESTANELWRRLEAKQDHCQNLPERNPIVIDFSTEVRDKLDIDPTERMNILNAFGVGNPFDTHLKRMQIQTWRMLILGQQPDPNDPKPIGWSLDNLHQGWVAINMFFAVNSNAELDSIYSVGTEAINQLVKEGLDPKIRIEVLHGGDGVKLTGRQATQFVNSKTKHNWQDGYRTIFIHYHIGTLSVNHKYGSMSICVVQPDSNIEYTEHAMKRPKTRGTDLNTDSMKTKYTTVIICENDKPAKKMAVVDSMTKNVTGKPSKQDPEYWNKQKITIFAGSTSTVLTGDKLKSWSNDPEAKVEVLQEKGLQNTIDPDAYSDEVFDMLNETECKGKSKTSIKKAKLRKSNRNGSAGKKSKGFFEANVRAITESLIRWSPAIRFQAEKISSNSNMKLSECIDVIDYSMIYTDMLKFDRSVVSTVAKQIDSLVEMFDE